MNRYICPNCRSGFDLLRMHGDEPFPDGFVVGIDVFDPVYTGMNLVYKGCGKRIIGICPTHAGMSLLMDRTLAIMDYSPRVYKDEFATPQLPKYVSFLTNIDQKVLSAKIYLKEMMHTDLVVEIRNNRNQQCVNRGNFFEEFSIRPVRTGMSRLEVLANGNGCNLLRACGDEPMSHEDYCHQNMSAPCVRGCPIEIREEQLIAVLFVHGDQL